MPKYLFQVSYNAEGTKALLAEGGSSRREAAEKVIASAGGTLESFYFAFGTTDAYVIADAPDHAAAAAIALAVSASGKVTASTTVLLTPEEIDAAGKVSLDYRPPGG